MIRFSLTITLFLFSFLSLNAQQEGRYWYFGQKGGLRFDSNGPVALNDGQVYTDEGSAVVSSAAGELLFYTDGISVWNHNHNLMPNGFGLLGNPSSTQSGVAVPNPGNPNRYYIFTIADVNSPGTGLNYSEVDLTLNGGLGDVIAQTKNTPLVGDCAEKLTAVRKADGSGYWVLCHAAYGTKYFCFGVSAGGVNNNPVVSSLGFNYTDIYQSMGYLKFSPDGKRIAAAYELQNTIELLDFNSMTGVVSQSLFLDDVNGNTYGVEFSQDNTKLYVSSLDGGWMGGSILQYDLSSGNTTQILASRTSIGTSTMIDYSALQLGPDGKIYVALRSQNKLAVIKNPNVVGMACGFTENGITLAPGTYSYWGLPTFMQSFFNNECASNNLRFLSLFKKTYVCADCSDGKIVAAGIGGVKPYQYSIDGVNFQNSGVFNNLTPGVYTVYIRDANGCMIKRVVKM